MEMATQTKGKTTARATAAAKVQATVKAARATATGNGNLYTQNISTVKEHTVKVESLVCHTERSAAKLAEMQNNKTKIKISLQKTKRNHLKFLINLYIKLTLCISQINESTLQIFKRKTKLNINFSSTNNNHAPQCIINLQQKLQEKAHSFKTHSFFKFKLVLEFLTRFHYFKRKAVRNYVKLTIRHFIGICLKRLISLKRLQQIPENHRQLDESLSTTYDKEYIKHRIDKDCLLCKEFIITLRRKKFMESLKALLSLQQRKIESVQNCKYYHTDGCHSCKNKPLIFEKKYFTYSGNAIFYQQCGQQSPRSSPNLQHQIILEKQLIAIKEIIVCVLCGSIDFKLRQHFLKCGQPVLNLNTGNKMTLKATVNIQLQRYTSSNKTELQETAIHFLKKCGQLFIISKCIHLNKYQIKALGICPHNHSKNFTKFYIQICIGFYKYCQLHCITTAVEPGYTQKNGIEAAIEKHEEICRYIPVFKLLRLSIDTCCKCGQLKNRRVVLEHKEELKAQLVSKVQKMYNIKPDKMKKTKTSEQPQFSLSSPQKCGQPTTKKTLYKQLLKMKCELGINFNSKLQETARGSYNQIMIFRNGDTREFNTNSPLKSGELNKQAGLININMLRDKQIIWGWEFHMEIKTAMKLQKLIEFIKEEHKFTLMVSLNIDKENMSHVQRKYIVLDSLYNQKNVSIFQHLQQNPHNFIERKFLNTTDSINVISKAFESQKIFRNISQKQTNVRQKLSIANGLRHQILHTFINGMHEIKLAYEANIARQFHLDDNNNSHQVESKHKRVLKKCQHILYSILLVYICCSCYWHIYGFPLVLVKIFKYLKDATVNVLTRRLKIAATATAAIATSVRCNDGSIKTACDGKLNKPAKVADYQQNIFKRQTAHTRTSSSTGAYSSSYCSTTLLTTSSSYCKCLKNLILQHKQAQQPCPLYCCCQEYHRHHHHRHHPHHYDQHKRQKQLKQPQQQHQQPQQYKFIATIHLQLPSLLAFSRTLIILMLLSSLWHTSEGFHGSGVKLSTNTVRTKYGLVRGIVVRSSPSLVEAYLGIPYASPPVGSLRFMPPITPSTWKNTRNADRFSPVCPQNVPIPPNGPEALLEVPRARLAQLRRLLPLLSNQSEDCLYLNIYVPIENRRHRRFTTNSAELNDTPKLPAILFIHGESYEWNSGNPYDGSELAAHGNIIVVTINFRLGILGFLKTGGKESAQGNFGLMDLVAGLHWLKENLPAFGGDPQQITLLGHGTGAALANILVVSPVASDLIQHTVMVSGSALSPWAIQKNPLFVKRRVAEQTGCHGDMLYYDLAPCLRTKTVAELLTVKIDHPRFLVGFAPFVDGTVISPNTDSIAKLSLPLGSAIVSTSGIEFANFPKRNLIFCLTSVESHLDLNAQDLEFGFNETRRDRILRTYVRNNFHYHLNEIFAVLKNEYTDWDKAIRSPLSSRDATLQFLSDGHTASSLIKLGYMHSLRGGKGYFLHFKHRTVEEEYPQRTGSVRGEDVPFWLGLPISPLFPHNYTTQEKQISRLMLRYLANFAKTGNPNQSSLSSPLPSSSSLIASHPSSPSSSSSSSSGTSDESPEKIKRSSSFNIVNATSSTSSGPIKSSKIIEDVATAAAREALNLAVLYNQRRTKRTYYKRHSRSNDDHSGDVSNEANYFISTNNNNNNNNDNNNSNKWDGDELPFWDAYDVVNQLYMELGNKAEIQSHYRGHKLSMWLNLIPQLHRHANMNDQSMRHHQFQDDLNNLNLYEGIVRAQMQTKPDDDDETLLLPKGRLATTPPPAPETNATQKPQGPTTECGVDGAMFVAELTTLPPADNRSLVLDSREKEMATASTGLIGNLEVLRRLSGKQFQSYTTALVATVAVGCFLLILNILIFAGIYHQREKRARDAKTKEELQDNDTSKNSSMLKLNAMGSETGSFNDSVGAGVSGKTTVLFGEYSCYDEKSLQTKDEKLIVELPPAQMVDANWAGCSTSTLDLLKTKHHAPLDTSYTLSNVVPINIEAQPEPLMAVNNLEMVTYNPLPMSSGLIIDPSFAATSSSSSGLLSKRGSVVGSSGQLNQYDFASVQSSDQMSFKDIENAVKASAAMNDAITQDDDIPEPPPPPRSFQSMQQQQQQQQQLLQQANAPAATSSSSSSTGGILRQAGATSTTQTGGGKKRVHIQEISV